MRSCPVCDRRLFITSALAGGRLYTCPKGHQTAYGRAQPRIRLVLGKINRRRRLVRWVRDLGRT